MNTFGDPGRLILVHLCDIMAPTWHQEHQARFIGVLLELSRTTSIVHTQLYWGLTPCEDCTYHMTHKPEFWYFQQVFQREHLLRRMFGDRAPTLDHVLKFDRVLDDIWERSGSELYIDDGPDGFMHAWDER